MVNKLNPQLEDLKQFLSKVPDLELAILIGSQVTGTAHDQSDWDIAVRWHQQAEISIIKLLGRPEVLRHDLAQFLNVSNEQIDLIDLTNVGLTMRAVVAEEGLVLKGEATLAWYHFLQRTWRDLEDFYWNKCYAEGVDANPNGFTG